MNAVTKGVFAIASYNASPNVIRNLRAHAADEGYDPIAGSITSRSSGG